MNGVSEKTDQMVQQLLANSDIKEFIHTYAASLKVADIAELKNTVDYLATVDFKMARQLAEVIWELARQLNDETSRAYAEAALGRTEYCYGHYRQALGHYQIAQALMERAGLAVEVAILQKQQVGVLMYLGNYREAISLASRARRVLKASGERAQLAELETNIGNLYCYLLDQYRKSIGYYEKARAIFLALGNEVSCARVEYNLANALKNLDRGDEALALYRRASQVYHKHKMFVYAAQADQYIALLLSRQGQFNEALKCYYQVRESQQQLGDQVSVAWCNTEMAELYLQLSAFEQSARLANSAQQSFLEFENTFKAAWAQTLNGLALAGLGQAEGARRKLSTALEEFAQQRSRVMVGLLHTYLADLELKAGNYQTARANAQEAERIFLRERLGIKAASARLVLAKLSYLTGNHKAANRLLVGVEQQAQRHNNTWLCYECYYLRGCLYEAAGEAQQALAQFSAAINIVNELRQHLCADELKSAFLRDKLDLFERAIELSFALYPDSACSLKYIEQAKSRSLADLLAHYVQRELAERLPQPELRERFLALLNELNWYNSAMQHGHSEEQTSKRHLRASYLREKQQSCEEELAELFRRIQIEHADYAELQRPATVELPELQRMLAPDEVLIEYFATGGHFSAIIITRESITTRRQLIGEDEIDQLLQRWQFQLGKFQFGREYLSRHLGRLEEHAKHYLQTLFNSLLAPLADLIADKALIIVPHGLLHYVPFHALYDGKHYLIERHAISYAPSMTTYALCQRQPLASEGASAGSLLILGLPDQNAPEIAREIAALAAIFPGARLLAEQEASLVNLKRYGPDCRILHFATHGVVRSDNPFFSYLKLADGELTFYNTFDLKLQAELVTLAGCHTGINHIFPGDELHGLMRGFLYAGTPSMVVSLWEADDRSTGELMVSFYRRLLAGDSKRDAIRAAQCEQIQHGQHPYYWASFLLMGKP